MDAKSILRAAQKFTIDNSPAILTAIGVAGTITTAILAGRASYSAALIVEEAMIPFGRGDAAEPTKREKLELVYKEFIPAAVVGTVTILAIIGANHVSSKRAAALAAAFKISEQMADEYRQKTVERLGRKAEDEMRADLAHDRMRRELANPLVIETGGLHPFFDEFSGRFFESSMQKVQDAVNQINHQINDAGYAGLDEFYDLLGLGKSEFSTEFGWNADELLDVYHTSVLLDDGRAAVAIRYNTKPFRHYEKCR